MQPVGGVDQLPLTISLFPTATRSGGRALGASNDSTWGEFVAFLSTRREGEKDGPNFVPARFKPEPDGRVRRLKENVIARTAVALDCETNKETGEVPPPVAEIVAQIEKQGWAAVVYTSHSHTAAAPRYRIVLPLTGEVPRELPAVDVVANLLGVDGVLDKGKRGASSVFYLPSANTGCLDVHETVTVSGTAIGTAWVQDSAGTLLAAREAVQAQQRAEAMAEAEKRREARIRAGYDEAESLIEAIRGRLNLADELVAHGYKKVGDKYLYPESETGIAGVNIMSGKGGIERVFSHHSGDPLADGNLPTWCRVNAIDVVDVVTILDYSGDRKRALRTLAKRFGIGGKKKKSGDAATGQVAPATEAEPANSSADKTEAADGTDGTEPPPAAEPEHDFTADIDAVVARFNAKYMVVNEAGKATIFQPGYDPILKRRRFDRLSIRDLIALYMNEIIQVGIDDKDRPIWKAVADIWLRHRDRRQFIHGVTFDPTTTRPQPDVLNLWEGFAVKPKPGDWSLLYAHIRDVICCGDAIRFDYLMGWMARMVQRPGEQGEVAVVMKGGEGTGKGTLAKAILKLMSQHGMAISNAKHLIGNFNGHLRDCVFLFADEAFFAGDKVHVGVLKNIITESCLTVEAKFQNAVQMPNFLHLMMASNEEWVVPASLDARRFLVLEVDGSNANNHEYFGAIWKQMAAGGYEAMLHDLLAMDLTTFNVRCVPTTEGLQQQRKLSLATPEAWWQDCLSRGYVFRSKFGLEKHFANWHDVASTELLFASYLEFATARREHRLMSREHLGKFMHRMGAKSARPRDLPVGEHMVDETTAFGGSHRVAKVIEHPRPPSYAVGDIKAARAAFAEATGLSVDWRDEEDAVAA